MDVWSFFQTKHKLADRRTNLINWSLQTKPIILSYSQVKTWVITGDCVRSSNYCQNRIATAMLFKSQSKQFTPQSTLTGPHHAERWVVENWELAKAEPLLKTWCERDITDTVLIETRYICIHTLQEWACENVFVLAILVNQANQKIYVCLSMTDMSTGRHGFTSNYVTHTKLKKATVELPLVCMQVRGITYDWWLTRQKAARKTLK